MAWIGRKINAFRLKRVNRKITSYEIDLQILGQRLKHVPASDAEYVQHLHFVRAWYRRKLAALHRKKAKISSKIKDKAKTG